MIYRDSAEHLEASNGQVAAVVTTGGRRIDADIVACGVGLHLNHDLLPPDRVGIDTGIMTNEFLETTTPDVYAAGDVAHYPGKVKLIACGFGEAAVAVNNAAAYLNPGASVFPGHSSSQSK